MAGALLHKFNGQAFTFMGDKGRFVLPPEFRNTLKQASDGRTLCLAKDDEFDCLVGFGLSREAEFDEQINREEEMAIRLDRPFNRTKRANQLYGFRKIPFDNSGRFIMPDYLQSLGKIDDGLYFQGAGTFFTIWNPAILTQQDDDWSSVKAACADLVTEARAKRK